MPTRSFHNRTHQQQFGYTRTVAYRRDKRLLFIAATCSLFVSLLFIAVLKSSARLNNETAEVQQEDIGVATVMLVTPRRDIRKGAKLTIGDFKLAYWPRSNVPEGALLELTNVKGKYARVDLSEDTPVTPKHLSEVPMDQTLDITEGNRAVTIPINEVTSNGFQIRPGSIVDVLLVYNDTKDRRHSRGKVIVEQARVVSMGGNPNPTNTRLRMKTATLDVNPEDGMLLIMSQKYGKLWLMLRNPADRGSHPFPQANGKEFFEGDSDSDTKVMKRVPKLCGHMKTESGEKFAIPCVGDMFPVEDELP